MKRMKRSTPVITIFKAPPEKISAIVRKIIVRVSKLAVITLITIFNSISGLNSRKPEVSLTISLVAL